MGRGRKRKKQRERKKIGFYFFILNFLFITFSIIWIIVKLVVYLPLTVSDKSS